MTPMAGWRWWRPRLRICRAANPRRPTTGGPSHHRTGIVSRVTAMATDKGVGGDETVSHVVSGRPSCRTDDGAETVAARSPTRRTRSPNPPQSVTQPAAPGRKPLYLT